MNGVEILTSEEVVVKSAFNWNAWFITFAAVFVVFIVVGLIMSLRENEDAPLFVFAIFGVVSGLLLGCIPGVEMPTPTEYKTQYEVTISDDVSMNEFMEKYEIIEQDGKLYTVRERD